MLKIILAAILLSSCTVHSQSNVEEGQQANKNIIGNKGIALLELFTSEGCSSCPAADKLAAQLKELYKDKLIVLEFHVDYWNRLGWKDPFSNAAYSQRQRDYGEKFQLESVYTPQAVINGMYEAAGSDEEKLKNFIGKSILSDTNSTLIINPEWNNNVLKVNFRYTGKAGSVINLALVQKKATVEINAGENEGRKLAHSNIVRDFITINGSNKSEVAELTIPEGLSKKDVQLIGYVQEKKSGKIITATVREQL